MGLASLKMMPIVGVPIRGIPPGELPTWGVSAGTLASQLGEAIVSESIVPQCFTPTYLESAPELAPELTPELAYDSGR